MLNVRMETGGIATITLRTPGLPARMAPTLLAALEAEVTAVAARPEVAGIILAVGSALAESDLSTFRDLPGDPHTIATAVAPLGAALRRIETCGKPVVAVAESSACGLGLEVLLACHYRIAANSPSAVFGLPDIALGLLPAAGGSQRLPRLIGIAPALPLLMDGRCVSAQEALKLGLVDAIGPAETLQATARALLRRGAVVAEARWDREGFALPGGSPNGAHRQQAFSRMNGQTLSRPGGLMPATSALLSCVFEGADLPLDTALGLERKRFAAVHAGPEARAMLRTLVFPRTQAPVAARPLSSIGIIGAGAMGRALARACVVGALDVVLVDADHVAAEAARGQILASVGRGTPAARLVSAGNYEALGHCDLVLEAMFEDRAVKARAIQAADAFMAPDAVLATTSWALPVAELAQASLRPDRLLGLRPCLPWERMELMEVARGPATSDAALARALAYVAQIGKVPLVVRDAFGFFTTRCIDAFIREGLRLVAEGVAAARVENAATALGMPMGPLALADAIGFDVLHQIKTEAKAAFGGAYVPDVSDVVYDAMCAAGRFGREAGAGFYDYTKGGQRLWQAPWADLPQADDRLPFQMVKRRLFFIQMLAADAALAQGIVTDMVTADMGAVLGWGFPRHLGGPFSAMDSIGLPAFVETAGRLAAIYGARFTPSELLCHQAAQRVSLFAAETPCPAESR